MLLYCNEDGSRWFLVPAALGGSSERAGAPWEVPAAVGLALGVVDAEACQGDFAQLLTRARSAAARIARAVEEVEDRIVRGPEAGSAPASFTDALDAVQRLQTELDALRQAVPGVPDPATDRFRGALGEPDPDAARFLAEYARREDVPEVLKIEIRKSLALRRALDEES